MFFELKLGDRVRVTAHYRGEDYRPGDRGTVSWVPPTDAGGVPAHYHVLMDANGPQGTSAIFSPREIEPDL